jgi:hypothetical protein
MLSYDTTSALIQVRDAPAGLPYRSLRQEQSVLFVTQFGAIQVSAVAGPDDEVIVLFARNSTTRIDLGEIADPLSFVEESARPTNTQSATQIPRIGLIVAALLDKLPNLLAKAQPRDAENLTAFARTLLEDDPATVYAHMPGVGVFEVCVALKSSYRENLLQTAQRQK